MPPIEPIELRTTPTLHLYLVTVTAHVAREDTAVVLEAEAYIDGSEEPINVKIDLGDDTEQIKRIIAELEKIAKQ